MHWYLYVGLVGSALIAIFTLPQLINLIKTRNTTYINIPMYTIYLIGCFLFFMGGVLLLCDHSEDLIKRCSSAIPLIVAQGTCGIISTIIFAWKLKNYFAAKKAKMPEAKYCEMAKKIYDDYKNGIKNLVAQSPKTNVVEEKQ